MGTYKKQWSFQRWHRTCWEDRWK